MKVIFISLVIFLCALATQTRKNKLRDASLTGKDFKISPHIFLEGNLKDLNGKYLKSQIDLTTVVSNLNGVLTIGKGGAFNKTCKDCKVDEKLVLACQCQDVNGTYKGSSLKLGSKIANINGVFTVQKK